MSSPVTATATPAGREILPPSATPRVARAPGPRSGFTLIELMIVTAVLGVLAMVAAPIYWNLRTDAAQRALEAQLRTLARAQEMYFVEHDVYTDAVGNLDYRPASHLVVELRVPGGSDEDPPGQGEPPGRGGPSGEGSPPGAGGAGAAAGWSARLTDDVYGVRCAVFYGDVEPYDPADVASEIACDEER